MKPKASSRTTSQFPTTVEVITQDHQHVKAVVPVEFERWYLIRMLGAHRVAEWIAIEWYAYERDNYVSQIDYDDRSRYFASSKFIAHNSRSLIPGQKEKS